MGFLEAYKAYWRNYVNFSGRSSRSEYWFAILWNVIIISILYILVLFIFLFSFTGVAALSSYSSSSSAYAALIPFMIMSSLVMLYGLATIIPSLSLVVRRLHDTNKSGWFILFGLIPFAGSIILLVFMCLPSEPAPAYSDRDNEFDI